MKQFNAHALGVQMLRAKARAFGRRSVASGSRTASAVGVSVAGLLSLLCGAAVFFAEILQL